MVRSVARVLRYRCMKVTGSRGSYTRDFLGKGQGFRDTS